MLGYEILGDKIVRFPRAIKSAAKILEYIQSLEHWNPSYIQNVPWAEHIREDIVIDAPHDPEIFGDYGIALEAAQTEYDRLFPNYIPLYEFDSQSEIYFSRYLNNGYIDVHSDIDSDNPDEDRSRAVSVICYYNDNYSGGELYFPRIGVEVKPEQGDIFMFPCMEEHGAKKASSLDVFTKYLSIYKLS